MRKMLEQQRTDGNKLQSTHQGMMVSFCPQWRKKSGVEPLGLTPADPKRLYDLL